MYPEIQISHHHVNDWTIVEIHGEADVYTVPRIREHLFDRIREGRHRIILDMLGVSFIDSTGLGLLVGIRKRMHPDEGELKLVSTNPSIRRIFKITGLHAVFRIYDSVEAAMTTSHDHDPFGNAPP
jgi:anti-sigma B factor antagonist